MQLVKSLGIIALLLTITFTSPVPQEGGPDVSTFQEAVTTITVLPVTIPTTSFAKRGNPFPPISNCAESTFEDTTSAGSPLISDCLVMASNIVRTSAVDRPVWMVESFIKQQHQLVQFGTCAFGVQGGKKGDLTFRVGNQDIIDIVHDAIKKFGRDSRVGAKGEMTCNAAVFPPRISWGIYKNPKK